MAGAKSRYVRRPDGSLLTPAGLPPANTQRWVMSRKADVVMAVKGGLITVEEACWRYRLTMEEFLTWQDAFERFGIRGLSGTRAQEIRKTRSSDRDPDKRPDVQTKGEMLSRRRIEPHKSKGTNRLRHG